MFSLLNYCLVTFCTFEANQKIVQKIVKNIVSKKKCNFHISTCSRLVQYSHITKTRMLQIKLPAQVFSS